MTLTRFQLKILAICSMFLDHAMKIFEDVLEPAMGQTLYTAVLSLGRMAFLIFAFQLAEGVWHTHNVKAYLKRLFGFALLAEIPFPVSYTHLINLTGELLVRVLYRAAGGEKPVYAMTSSLPIQEVLYVEGMTAEDAVNVMAERCV